MYGTIAVAAFSIVAAVSPTFSQLTSRDAAASASGRVRGLDRMAIIRRLYERRVKPLIIAPPRNASSTPARYSSIRRIDFPTPGTSIENDHPNGIATDLNNLGQVTYYAAYSSLNVVPAYVINDDGSYRQLSASIFAPFLGCPYLVASVTPMALNDVGGVAGFYSYSVDCGKSLVFGSNIGWQLKGGEYDVSYVDGYVDGARAFALNDSNVAAGVSGSDPKYVMNQALTFSEREHRRPLLDLYRLPCVGAVPGSLFSEATGINDAGLATGVESVECPGGGTYKAVLFDPHSYAKQLFPASSNEFVSEGEAINGAGDIVGYAGYNDVGSFRAFLYRAACRCVKYLPTPGGGAAGDGQPLAINASDEIVGQVYEASTRSSTAFIYKNGMSYDLNSLLPKNSGWTLFAATNINDAGEIIGEGQYLDPSTNMLEEGVFAMKP